MGSIVVFGATGFTGRLVVSALRALGAFDVILGGRDEGRLRQLSAEHGGLPYRVADARRPETLGGLVRGARVVVDTAGPFAQLGEPVVRAAIEAGAHFLDTTGEQAYMVAVLRRYHAIARQERVAVVNAHAFEFALGCCAAARLVDADPSIDTIDVFNRIAHLAASRGSRMSAVGILAERGVALERGRLRPLRIPRFPRAVTMPDASRRELSVPIPGGEALHLRRSHPGVENVTTNMVLPDALAIAALGVLALRPALHALARPRLRDAIAALVDRGPEGPTDAERRIQGAQVFVLGRRLGETARPDRIDAGLGGARGVLIRGVDPYGLTGVIAAVGAKMLLEGDPRDVGVIGPHQAFGATALLDALAPHGVRVSEHDLPRA